MNISAVLLAGGESRRMGEDKPFSCATNRSGKFSSSFCENWIRRRFLFLQELTRPGGLTTCNLWQTILRRAAPSVDWLLR